MALTDELVDFVFQQSIHDQQTGMTGEGLQRVLDTGQDLGDWQRELGLPTP
jgi:hypothetical protein